MERSVGGLTPRSLYSYNSRLLLAMLVELSGLAHEHGHVVSWI